MPQCVKKSPYGRVAFRRTLERQRRSDVMERGPVESRIVPLAWVLLLMALGVAALPEAAHAQVPAKVGSELPVNSFITGDQVRPAVAVGDDASFDVVWESDGHGQNQGHGPG